MSSCHSRSNCLVRTYATLGQAFKRHVSPMICNCRSAQLRGIRAVRGYDVMVACQLPKLIARVRFPLPAPAFSARHRAVFGRSKNPQFCWRDYCLGSRSGSVEFPSALLNGGLSTHTAPDKSVNIFLFRSHHLRNLALRDAGIRCRSWWHWKSLPSLVASTIAATAVAPAEAPDPRPSSCPMYRPPPLVDLPSVFARLLRKHRSTTR